MQLDRASLSVNPQVTVRSTGSLPGPSVGSPASGPLGPTPLSSGRDLNQVETPIAWANSLLLDPFRLPPSRPSPSTLAGLKKLDAVVTDVPIARRLVRELVNRYREPELGKLVDALNRAGEIVPAGDLRPLAGGKVLVRTLLIHLDEPSCIYQGNGTVACTSASLQAILARSMPGEYVRIACELVESGNARVGEKGKVSTHKSDVTAGDGRDPLSSAIQGAFDRLMGVKARQGVSADQFADLYRMVTGQNFVFTKPDQEILNNLQASGPLGASPVLLKPGASSMLGHAVTILQIDQERVVIDDPASRQNVMMSMKEFLSKAAAILMPQILGPFRKLPEVTTVEFDSGAKFFRTGRSAKG